jgi:hypothetical protein
MVVGGNCAVEGAASYGFCMNNDNTTSEREKEDDEAHLLMLIINLWQKDEDHRDGAGELRPYE